MSPIDDRLIQQIADHADEIEELGRIPASLVSDLKDANYFSLLLPSACGGKQLPYPEFLKVVQAVARADGSTGWCVNQGSVLTTLANQMPNEVTQVIWQDPGTAIANGPPGNCEVTQVDGGYLLNGHWSFSSGIDHASWLVAVAPLKKDGKTVRVLWCFLPKAEAVIQEDWQVNGLKGTASYQFSVKDLIIPAEMTLTYSMDQNNPPLYRVPMNLLFACGFGAVALGVSRGALDFALRRIQEKVKRFEQNTMSANETVQVQAGRAEALWQSAESFLHNSVAKVWSDLEAGEELRTEHRIALRMAGTHVIRQSMDITDIAYALCSTDSIFMTNDIQRRFQDMHVITQHLQGRTDIYALLGRYYLDLPFESYLIS
jgi:alkylation response protein AidB-like acyl-CoA dehydrogenase|tara:strand:- start:2754 stop:3872 length:1119 start_codon:yes stop_codon:yes gene_type:complete